MTVLEAFQNWSNGYLSDKVSAKYFLEDVDRSKIVTFTDKQAKVISEVVDGEDDIKVIRYADITDIQFFPNSPPDHPHVDKSDTLLIKTDKQTVVVACLSYDYNSIEAIVHAGMSEKGSE